MLAFDQGDMEIRDVFHWLNAANVILVMCSWQSRWKPQIIYHIIKLFITCLKTVRSIPNHRSNTYAKSSQLPILSIIEVSYSKATISFHTNFLILHHSQAFKINCIYPHNSKYQTSSTNMDIANSSRNDAGKWKQIIKVIWQLDQWSYTIWRGLY